MNAEHVDDSGWQGKVIALFEHVSNFAFYLLAFFILLIPPLKWVVDVFPSTDDTWWLIASIIVFVIIMPLLLPVLAQASLPFLEKLRNGQFLSVIFKPLKSILV